MNARSFAAMALAAIMLASVSVFPVIAGAQEMRTGQEWHGITGGPASFATAVIRSPDQWRRLWAELGREPPAALNGETQMAVAVFLGLRRTGGYGVTIPSVRYEGSRLVVRYTERRPAAGSFVPQVLTSPYVVKVLARVPGEVVFRKR